MSSVLCVRLPKWTINPTGYFVIVKNGYSSISVLSCVNGGFNFVVIRPSIFPGCLGSFVLREFPKNDCQNK